MTCCVKPNITKLNEDYYVCLNCLFSSPITDKKSDDCCDNSNINSEGICINCGTIHKIFTNKLEFKKMMLIKQMFYTKLKKVHNPYRYLKKNYPQIKNEKNI